MDKSEKMSGFALDIKQLSFGVDEFLNSKNLDAKDKSIVLSLCLARNLCEHSDEKQCEYLLRLVKYFYLKANKYYKDGDQSG